jgi:hypothetical protein
MLPAYIPIAPPPGAEPGRLDLPGGYGPYNVLRTIQEREFAGLAAYFAVAQVTGPPAVVYDPFRKEGRCGDRACEASPRSYMSQAMLKCLQKLTGERAERIFFQMEGEGAVALAFTHKIQYLEAVSANPPAYELRDIDAGFLCVGYRVNARQLLRGYETGDPPQDLVQEIDRLLAEEAGRSLVNALNQATAADILASLLELFRLVRPVEDYRVENPRLDVAVTARVRAREAIFFPTPTPTPPTSTPIPAPTRPAR